MSTASKEKKLINLIRGWPAPAILPAEQLSRASAKVLSNPAIFVPVLQYGPDAGYQPLREELATYLSRNFGVSRDPARICITGGASQSAACIAQSFTDRPYTKGVWMVAPCYHLMCPVFEDSGFRGLLHAVPEDEEGIDLAWLEKGLDSENIDPDEPVHKDLSPHRKAYRHLIYCVPTCSNPSGKSMTAQRRRDLVRLARKHDALIICDDVYDFLQWPILAESPDRFGSLAGRPLPPVTLLPRLVDIDLQLGPSAHDTRDGKHFGHAISNGSFSKLVGPGVRTGWVEGAPAFAFGLAQTGSTKSGGAPSQLAAAIVCGMLASGELDAHIHGTVRPALQRRHALIVSAVKRHLGDFVDVIQESSVAGTGWYGGYFVWLRLRNGRSAAEVAHRAKLDENLIVAPGSLFEVKGDQESVQFGHNIRLCYSWEDEQNILDGIKRLARVLKSWDEPRGSCSETTDAGLDGFK